MAQTPTSASPTPASPAPQRRRKKWVVLGIALGSLVLLLVVFVLMLPAMISGGLLRGTLLKTADDLVAGSITWDKLNLAWGRGQSIEGLRVLDAQGKVLLHAPKADAPDVSLRSLVFGSKALGNVTLVIDQADIVQEPDGQLNIVKALAFTEPAKPRTPYPAPLEGWTATAQLKASGITIKPVDAPAMQIPMLEAAADLSDPGSHVGLTYQLVIQQDQQPAGQSQGSVTLRNVFTPTGDLQLGAAQVQAQADVTQFPVSLLAALIGQDQRLQQTLGNALDARLALDGPALSPKGEVALRTPALTVQADLTSSDDTLALAPGRIIHFQINDQAWQAWSGDPQMQLEKPVELEVQVRGLAMPRKGLAFDWPAAQLDLQVSATPMLLRGSAEMGRLSLSEVQATIRSEALGKRLAIAAQAAASKDEHQGRFKLDAQISDLTDAQGKADLTQLRASLDMQAADLPVALADQLLASPGRYEALLGSRLQARATAGIEPAGNDTLATGPFELVLNSDHLQGRIAGTLGAQALTTDGQSAFTLRLTSAGAAAMGMPDGMLQNPASLRLAITQLSVPRRDNTLAIEQAKAQVAFTSEPMVLAGIGRFQSLSVTGLEVNLSSESLGDEVKLTSSITTQADGRTGSVSAEGSLRHLMAYAQTQPATQPAMEVSIKAQARQLPAAFLEGFTGSAGSIEPWVGGLLDVVIHAQATQGRSSWFEQGSAAAQLQSELLQADLLALLDQGILRVQPASQIELQLTTNALEAQGLTFAKPVKVVVKPGKISLPVSPVKLEDLAIEKLTLQTTPIDPAGDLAMTGYSISSLQGQVSTPRLGDQLTLAIDGKASRAGVADSPIVVRANLRQPLSPQRTGDGRVLVEQVAVPVVDMILKQQGLLTDALGPLVEKLEVKLQTTQTPTADAPTAWRYQLALNASNLSVPSLQGRFTPGQHVEVDPGASARLTLTPALYARLTAEPAAESAGAGGAGAAGADRTTGNPIRSILGAVLPPRSAAAKAAQQNQPPEAYVLASPANVVLTLQGAKLNLSPKAHATAPAEGAADQAQPTDLSDVSFDATLTLDQLALTRPVAGDTQTLRDVKATLQTRPVASKELHVKMTGQTLSQPQAQQGPGSMDVDLTLQGLSMLPQGGLNWYDAQISTRMALTAFPTPVIDQLAGQQGRLTSLLGPAVDSQITGSMPGELDVSLQSPQSSLSAKMTIDAQRVVRLREDLTLELSPTPEAGAVLGLINPQLMALESAKEPLSLVVRRQGFELPLPRPGQPLDMQRVRSDLTLNLGQVQLRREGIIKDVFDVLAGVGARYVPGALMDVRFTPLEVKLAGGQLTTNDLWMINPELVMGTQAKIDLNRPGMPAVIHLGISGQTLRQLPGARSNLPADMVVDVKLAAPLGEIMLDKSALAVQLTPLLAATYGGKEGAQVIQGVTQGISLLERLAGKKSADMQDVQWPNHPKPVVTTQPATTQPATTQPAATQPAAEPARQNESQGRQVNPLDRLIDRLRSR